MIDSVSESAGSTPDLKRARRRKVETIESDQEARLIPQALEAERGVLGCVLLSPITCLGLCVEKIDSKEAFYDLRHQSIYKCLLKMYEAREPIDIISAQQKLKDAGKLESIGGIPYLNELANNVPSAANLSYYLDIVLEKYLLRKMLATCEEVTAKVYTHTGNVANLLDEAEREFLSIRNVSIGRESETGNLPACRELQDEYALAFEHKRPIGIGTGWSDVDYRMGGMRGQQMIVLAASPSVGKSAFAMNVAEYQARQGNPVGVFSLEMSKKEILHRLICSYGKVDGSRIQGGQSDDEEIARSQKAMSDVLKLPIHINDEGGLTLAKLAAKARRMKTKFGIKLLVIDYLQLVGSGKNVSSIREDVTYVSNGIKQLAKELDIPVIVLSQINREAVKANRPPALYDLRESGSIEQDADKVIFLHVESDESEEVVQVAIIFAKNRAGKKGIAHLMFLKQFTRFESMSRVNEDE